MTDPDNITAAVLIAVLAAACAGLQLGALFAEHIVDAGWWTP